MPLMDHFWCDGVLKVEKAHNPSWDYAIRVMGHTSSGNHHKFWIYLGDLQALILITSLNPLMNKKAKEAAHTRHIIRAFEAKQRKIKQITERTATSPLALPCPEWAKPTALAGDWIG